MWKLDCEEIWAPKNWFFWTVVLEKTLESPLDCKEIQPVHPKGDQSWVFIGRTDVTTPCEELTHWKIPWCWEGLGAGEKGTTEDEMAGWHHRLDGHEFEWTLGVGDGQGGLACCDSWGHTESYTTEWLNWTAFWTLLLTTISTLILPRDSWSSELNLPLPVHFSSLIPKMSRFTLTFTISFYQSMSRR